MRQLHAIVLLAVLFFACSEKVIEQPENLLPKEKMIEIYYDLTVLGSVNTIDGAILKKNNVAIMPYIYKKYNTDSLQFVQSDLYYASIPSDYEAMYAVILQRLETQEKKYEEARKKRSDSIKEANKKKVR